MYSWEKASIAPSTPRRGVTNRRAQRTVDKVPRRAYCIRERLHAGVRFAYFILTMGAAIPSAFARSAVHSALFCVTASEASEPYLLSSSGMHACGMAKKTAFKSRKGHLLLTQTRTDCISISSRRIGVCLVLKQHVQQIPSTYPRVNEGCFKKGGGKRYSEARWVANVRAQSENESFAREDEHSFPHIHSF